jgi:regulatory protein
MNEQMSKAAALFAPKPPTVTGIMPTRRDPSLLEIRVEDRRVISLDAESIDLLGIKIGTAWTSELEKKSMRAADVQTAGRRAVRLLAARGRCSFELITILRELGFVEDVAREAVARVIALGVLDDHRYAQEYARREIDERPGPKRPVIESLMKLGYTEAAATKAFEAAAGSENDLQRAVRAASDAARPRARGLGVASQEWRRLFNLLTRRGFDEHVAMQAIEVVLGPPPDA